MTISNRTDKHVVIFPFMAKGHTIPLLHLSAILARRDVKVTLFTTLGNSAYIHSYLGLPLANIRVHALLFPETHPSIPRGCESTDQLPSFHQYKHFLRATRLLDGPFRSALQGLGDSDALPVFVVSDFFLWWTGPICSEFGVPWLVFHGMGVFAMAVIKSILFHQPHLQVPIDTGAEFHVPGAPEELRLKLSDAPHDVLNTVDSPFQEFVQDIGEAERNSSGVLVNSFTGLESDVYVSLLERFYRKGARAWLVGPLALHPLPASPASPLEAGFVEACMQWLDKKPAGSVIYVAFGTQADVSNEQLDEIIHGLEMSGHHFLFIVRSSAWVPPKGMLELLEGTKQAGLIHRGWAPQKEILAHASTGGFLSHCGWNSVLESVSAGVPILACPFIAEQSLNAKFVAEVAQVGLRVHGGDGGVVVREAICEGVRELMGGIKGKKARQKAGEMKERARSAVGERGSSGRTLDKLLEDIRFAAAPEKL